MALALGATASAQSQGGPYRITRHAIAAGGVRAEAGDVEVVATYAQYHAASASGGRFRLTGGFHKPVKAADLDPFLVDGFEP